MRLGKRRRGEEPRGARAVGRVRRDGDGLHRLTENPSAATIGEHHLEPKSRPLARFDHEGLAAVGDEKHAVRNAGTRTQSRLFYDHPRERIYRGFCPRQTNARERKSQGDHLPIKSLHRVKERGPGGGTAREPRRRAPSPLLPRSRDGRCVTQLGAREAGDFGVLRTNPHRFDAIIVASPCRLKIPAYCSWNCAPLPLHVSTSRTANERGAREPGARERSERGIFADTNKCFAIFAVTVMTACTSPYVPPNPASPRWRPFILCRSR